MVLLIYFIYFQNYHFTYFSNLIHHISNFSIYWSRLSLTSYEQIYFFSTAIYISLYYNTRNTNIFFFKTANFILKEERQEEQKQTTANEKTKQKK